VVSPLDKLHAFPTFVRSKTEARERPSKKRFMGPAEAEPGAADGDTVVTNASTATVSVTPAAAAAAAAAVGVSSASAVNDSTRALAGAPATASVTPMEVMPAEVRSDAAPETDAADDTLHSTTAPEPGSVQAVHTTPVQSAITHETNEADMVMTPAGPLPQAGDALVPDAASISTEGAEAGLPAVDANPTVEPVTDGAAAVSENTAVITPENAPAPSRKRDRTRQVHLSVYSWCEHHQFAHPPVC